MMAVVSIIEYISNEIKTHKYTYAVIYFLFLFFVFQMLLVDDPMLVGFTLEGGINILRLLTSVMAHLSLSHLLRNIAGFLLVARPVERKIGGKIVIVTFFGAIIGNLLFSMSTFFFGDGGSIIGVSAGVYSIIMLCGLVYLKHHSRRVRILGVGILTFSIVRQLVGYSLEISGVDVLTAYIAHIGGLLIGLIAYIVLCSPIPVKQKIRNLFTWRPRITRNDTLRFLR